MAIVLALLIHATAPAGDPFTREWPMPEPMTFTDYRKRKQ